MYGYRGKFTSITEQKFRLVIEFPLITGVRLSRYYCINSMINIDDAGFADYEYSLSIEQSEQLDFSEMNDCQLTVGLAYICFL